MPRVIIPIGLPCCGKSTVGKRLQEVTLGRVIRLGPDDLREEMHPGYEAGEVDFDEIDDHDIFLAAFVRGLGVLSAGKDLWWDATNVIPRMRLSAIWHLSEVPDVKCVALDLDVPFDVILERNTKCRPAKRCPPQSVLLAMQKNKEKCPAALEDGFSEVWHASWAGDHWVAEDVSDEEVRSALGLEDSKSPESAPGAH